MSEDSIESVLRAWSVAERITGGNIETGKKEVKWLRGDLLQKAELAYDDESQRLPDTNSLIYLGEYSKQKVRQAIQEQLFTNDLSLAINKDKSIGYSVALVVDESWRLEKIVIPYAAYFYLMLRQGNCHEAIRGDKFEDFKSQLFQDLSHHLSSANKGVYAEMAIANSIVQSEFGIDTKPEVVTTSLRGYFNYRNEPAMLDSFYADDLNTVLADSNDRMLTDYIDGRISDHIDIDQNRQFIANLLKIDNLPDGRWPSEVEFSQSLMQQVAINIISDKASDKSDLRTVNGPPGTGKTTLLKDVFANQVVEQAKVMAKFDNPRNGYNKLGQVELFPGYNYNSYELKPELQGFGTVVASNNNSAVANITKDFPKTAAIKQHAGSDTTNEYLEDIKQIDYFSELANEILGSAGKDGNWGLFSVPMGSKKNRNHVFDILSAKTNNVSSLDQILNQATRNDTWSAARSNFKQALKAVKETKKQLLQDIKLVTSFDKNKLDSLKQQIASLNLTELRKQLDDLTLQLSDQERALKLLPKRRFLFFWYLETQERNVLRTEMSHNYSNKSKLRTILNQSQRLARQFEQEIQQQEKQAKQVALIQRKFIDQKTFIFNDDYWNQENRDIQLHLVNNSLSLQDARARLFIAAIRLRKAFIAGSTQQMRNAWTIFENQDHLIFPRNNRDDKNETELCRDDEHHLVAAFQITQLLIPVMSTTLASVQRMFANFGKNTIDNVVVDEAGQATPASVVGLLWRAKRFVAVGDPAQIEPVVTTSEATLRMLARDYDIDEKYLLPTTSVQQLADQASVYGTTKPDGSWIGYPLWVHRRCDSPMFEIANKISYDDRMVQGKANSQDHCGTSQWLNSIGHTTTGQFVPDNVTVLVQSIHERIQSGKKLKDMYIISPFTAVVAGVKDKLKAEFNNISVPQNWFNTNIGTVHTFQGKEAKIVYFVIGTDKNTDGAADWAFSKPNLLNVAVTRAKQEFYVIGDIERLSKKPFISVAATKLNKTPGLDIPTSI